MGEPSLTSYRFQTTAAMKLVLQGLVLLLAGVRSRVSCASEDVTQCPTWKWFNYSSGSCQCGHDIMGTIKCSEAENSSVYARFDVCVSWDSHSQTVLTSVCKYKRSRRTSVTDRVFSKLPLSPYNLSFDECELNNREGIFCGECKKGFAPSLYIFRGMCTECSNCLQNPASLFLFLTLEILPPTLFYLIIMVLHLNIMSGPMLGYIIFCQVHINLLHIHPNIWRFFLTNSGRYLFIWNVYLLLPLAGVWNLNFFAMFATGLCYSCYLNNLATILMEYLSVLYIFILVALSYLFGRIDLKNKLASCRFCKCILYSFIKWRQSWNVSDSVIHAFATFSALLFAKVGAISVRLIAGKQMHNINGTLVKSVLSFEPSIEQFSRNHAPYAAVAFVSLFFFVVIPVFVVCLHPSPHFQNLLARCCGPRKRLALAIFVDTISSGYRDGLDGGRDWRRLFPLTMISFTGTVAIFVYSFHTLPDTYIVYLFPLFLALPFSILYFKPCKTKEMNLSLAFHLIVMALTTLTFAAWMQDYFLNSLTLEVFLTVCLTLPHVVMLLWLSSNIIQRCQSLKNCYLKAKQVSFGRAQFLLQGY